MSFGKMNGFAEIVLPEHHMDAEGFSTATDAAVASVRVYREGRHGTERWANRAAFTEATDLFRFRSIPGTEITTAMQILCGGRRFDVLSVENVRSRGMYVEVLAKEVHPSGELQI